MEGLENVTRSRVELAVKFRLDRARIRLAVLLVLLRTS